MKEIKKEVISYNISYQAVDGTEFENKEDCIKYDKSFAGVLKGRLAEMSLNVTTEDNIFDCGSCDNTVYVCVPKSSNDIEAIKQVVIGFGHSESYANQLNDESIGRVVLVTIGYNNEWACLRKLDQFVEFATDGKYKVVEA